MPTLYETDIINSATPLETRFAGVHPRMYVSDEEIEEIKGRLTRQPWTDFLRRTRVVANSRLDAAGPFRGDIRGVGDGLAHLAVVYRLTGEAKYLDAARDQLVRMAAHDDWSESLIFGHWAHGIALAYDWLYHHLGEPLRRTVREALLAQCRGVFAELTAYRDALPTGYAWNHTGVVHTGLFAAGCALWGDIDGVGPILRFGLEKLRLLADALGPDGASAEGLAYGQYHNDAMLKSMTLADRLMGLDYFQESSFFRNYPLFMLYSTFPRAAWAPASVFMIFGDADGAHWYGPDAQLRIVARRYRDGRAQWLADETAAAGVCAESSSYFNLIFHDDSVAPQGPDALPTVCHLADKGIVFMRSGWDADAALLGVKCGPNQGYHAARRYRNNVGGGHMHPDAGHVLLHAHGDRLLIDSGYTKKFTAYRNTLLVNGVGQTGEGGTWFEDLEMRRGKPEGRILRADSTPAADYVIADAGPAYERSARLSKFLRHVLYLKPDVWLLVDEIEAEAASTFDLRFHAPRAFVPAGGAVWSTRGERGALQLLALGPTPLVGRAFCDRAIGASGNHPDRPLETLSITNSSPAAAALFITLLHTHRAEDEPRVKVSLGGVMPELWVEVEGAGRKTFINVNPNQADPAAPACTVA